MMAFDRIHTENDLIRPETSKFSRSSKRSHFNMTLSNFNSNTNNQNLNPKQLMPKHETQMNFYTSGNHSAKTNGFSASVYDPKGGMNKKKTSHVNKPEKTEPVFPEPIKNEGTEPMSSSVGFRLTSGEIKKGVTLDKVLGAGFKKIDIFDANLKEFENKTFLPPHIIDEKVNEMSDVEGEDGDEKYQYESFEIVETENEEEGNPESQQSSRNFRGEERKDNKDRPKGDGIDDVKNSEVLDKIQKKYKSSKSKNLYKKRSKLLSKAQGPDGELLENQDSERDISNTEYPPPPFDRRGREYTIGKIESKSLSPKINQDMKKPRFQGPPNFENPKPMGGTQYPAFSNNNSNTNANTNAVFKTSKQQFYPKNEIKNETQNAFRTSSTSFRTTKESLKNDIENANNLNNPYKKTFQNRPPNNYEIEKEKQYTEFEESNNRSNSLINADQFSESSLKFYSEKMSNNNQLEKKFHRENKIINDKIKQYEMDMIDKYSKLFKFNNEEKFQLYKGDEKKPELPKRLSTPMKDFDANRGFNRKKFMNL